MRRMKATVVLFLIGLAVSTQPAAAQDEIGLPHAFDAGWAGQKTCEVLFEAATMTAARCVFPPGVGHEKHYHRPHFGYVLEGGTLRISDADGDRVVTTEAGSSWSTEEVTVHEAMNTGDTTTSYLIVEPRAD